MTEPLTTFEPLPRDSARGLAASLEISPSAVSLCVPSPVPLSWADSADGATATLVAMRTMAKNARQAFLILLLGGLFVMSIRSRVGSCGVLPPAETR